MALTYTISAIDNFSGVFDKVSSKVEAVGKKMTDVGKQMSLKVTAPIVGVGTAAFAAADSMDKAYNNIAISSGAVGGDLENLKGTFMEVFKEIPDSADVASNALANLNTLTGAVDDDLKNLTKSVLDASRTLGEDGVANSVAFGKAMKQWQIPTEEGTKELDKLYKLTQDYGVGLGDISSQLTAYGAILNNAGFEMDETAHFFASLASEGLAVSRIMPALNAAFRNWAAEGKDSRVELQRVINTIETLEDSQEALALATEVFGAQGAQRLTTAIKNGTIPALDELGDMFEGTAGLIDSTSNATKTVGDRLAEIKNQAQIGLVPLGEIILDLVQEYLPPLIDYVSRFADWMSNLDPKVLKVATAIGGVLAVIGPLLTLFGMLLPAIKAIGVAMAVLTGPVGLVVAAVAGLIAIGVLLYKNWDEISAWLSETWEKIKDFALNVFSSIADFFKEWGPLILAIITGPVGMLVYAVIEYWDEIKAFTTKVFTAIGDFFKDIWESITGFVTDTIGNIVGFVIDGWNSLKDRTKSIWDGIVSVIKAPANMMIGIANAVMGAFEKMLNGVGNAINKIPSFDIPDWVPLIGGKSFSLPKIPTVSLPKIPSLDIGTDRVFSDGLAMLHAGEAIVPAAEVERGGFGGRGGGNISIVINNPQVRNDRDIDRIGKELVDRIRLKTGMRI